MSENALYRKGELGRYSTRSNQKLTRQCEQASGNLHPCKKTISNKFKLLNGQVCLTYRGNHVLKGATIKGK